MRTLAFATVFLFSSSVWESLLTEGPFTYSFTYSVHCFNSLTFLHLFCSISRVSLSNSAHKIWFLYDCLTCKDIQNVKISSCTKPGQKAMAVKKSIEIHKDGRDEVIARRNMALETELPEDILSN